VYAPACQMKAVGGVERSRTRRGTKKRGSGSEIRKSLKRALARVARDGYLSSIPRILGRADRARERIDKRHDRGCEFLLRLQTRLIAVTETLTDLREQIADAMRPRSTKGRLRTSRDRLSVVQKVLKVKVESIASALWGLPPDLTRVRLTKSSLPNWRVLPRVTLTRWALSDGECGARARAQVMAATQTVLRIKNIPCVCARCRTSVLCPAGHGVSAGIFSCGFCGWQRHDGQPVKRTGWSRRGDRKNPVGAPPRRT